MMKITIVGLGPGDPELLTRRAWRILGEAEEVYLRTAIHPGVKELPVKVLHSFDDKYEAAEDFATLYEQIADEVVTLGKRPGGVVYAVPGHPLVGETTVSLILARAGAQNIPAEIVDGLSFIEPTLSTLGLDALNGVQIYDAVDVGHRHHPPLNPDAPAILAQVYSEQVASDVKLTLANQYPEDHEVILIHGAGTSDAQLETIPLHQIDHSTAIDHLTSLFVPAVKRPGSFEYFQEIIAHLRAPEGCPWDRKQTHESLREYLLEETYEVLETIDGDDPDALRKELGDLMLQIVLHTQIATEAGEFQMVDVINHVTEKLIRRHPHVWGDVEVSGAEQVHANWDQIKKQEKSQNGDSSPAAKSVFDGVPEALPALAQASAYHQRAARTGFDWPDVEGVVLKLKEEIDELLKAESDEHRAEELGDVLTTVVNVARWYKIDPETALRQANRKFARRFRHIEAGARDSGREVEQLTLAEMEKLWGEAKKAEEAGA
jgi:tetrapyrrole methylase family protein/MazG family protein